MTGKEKAAKRELASYQMTLRVDGSVSPEYRVAFREEGNTSEAAAYYTNDLEDAIATGKSMRNRRDAQTMIGDR